MKRSLARGLAAFVMAAGSVPALLAAPGVAEQVPKVWVAGPNPAPCYRSVKVNGKSTNRRVACYEVRPSTIAVSEDGDDFLSSLRWTTWTAAGAVATGLRLQRCWGYYPPGHRDPHCPVGTTKLGYDVPVKVTLSAPVATSHGTVFTLLTESGQPGPICVKRDENCLEQLAERLKGVNWADPTDNFQPKVRGASPWVIPTGLSASDSASTVYAKATAILKGFQRAGANTVRLPINVPTVLDKGPGWWPRYRRAIDAALALHMNVVLSYWASSSKTGTIGSPNGGTSSDLGHYSGFEHMWDRVIADYASQANVYFEIMNEPWGYTSREWESLAQQWLARYPTVPQDRVLVSATYSGGGCVGLQNNLSQVAHDPQLAGVLLSFHFYNWCGSGVNNAAAFKDLVGPYIDHGVVVDEFGTNLVTKNGAPVNFGRASQDQNISYMRALTHDLHSGFGAVYWPGLKAHDPYGVWRLSSRSQWWLDGSDPLVLNGNGSILPLLQQAWS